MGRRRGHGEGSIYKRSDKRWCGSVDLGWQDGKRRRKNVYGSTQAEVKEKILEVRAAQAAGLPIANDRLTVEQQLLRWLELLPEHLSPNTVDNYRWAVHNHLIPALGKHRLRDLTPTDVTEFLKRKHELGLARSSCYRLRSVLVKAVRQAEIDNVVQRNVAALSSNVAVGVKPGRSLTEEEATALLKAFKGQRLEALFTLMLTMGLRPGEASGLTWEHIDMDLGVLHVRQSLKLQRGQLTLGDVKTPKSRRSLSMPAIATSAIRQHRKRQLEDRMRAGSLWRDSDLVFTTELGTPIDPANLRRSLTQITTATDLGHWTPNELRHSAVSLLSAAGVPIEEIADVVGHDGFRMTTGIYRHVLSPVISAGASPMDEMFGTG